MTTSANIAGTIQPFAMISPGGRGGDAPWPYGKKKIYHINDIKPGKKPKIGAPFYYGKVGMLWLDRGTNMGEAISKQIGPDSYEFQGKKGKWRDVNKKAYFFPDDGSGPIPAVRTGDKGEKGGGGGEGEKDDEGKKDDDEGGGIPNRESLLDSVEKMIKKAGDSKKGKIVLPALGQMKGALTKNDEKAFKKASKALAKAKKKLKKAK